MKIRRPWVRRFQRALFRRQTIRLEPSALEATRTQGGSEEDLMFCPSCGFEYTQKTNYCKRCGEELNAAPQAIGGDPQRFRTGGIFYAVAMFGILGLFLNLLSFHVLLDKRDFPEAFITFVLGLLLVGVITGLLIKQLSRLIAVYQKSNQDPAQERVIIREVQVPHLGAQTDQVRNAVEPSSVVEHTTRQMAGVHSEPKAVK